MFFFQIQWNSWSTLTNNEDRFNYITKLINDSDNK